MTTIHRHTAKANPDKVIVEVTNHMDDANKSFSANEISKAYAYAKTLENNSVVRMTSEYACSSCDWIVKTTNEIVAIVYVDPISTANANRDSSRSKYPNQYVTTL